jgi:trans-2,3-dihydro-3-hydroxyanthranilate isomerase
VKKLHYHLVDVFTDRLFGGNQLAVFTDGRGVSPELMQSIARELNLAETTFVLPAEKAGTDFRVRIFTPLAELPMAGHPTIGTAFVLAREKKVTGSLVTFEEGVGPVPVTIGPGRIEMQQPLPSYGARFEAAPIAEMLSLDASAIKETGLPLEVVSCGVPFLFVPVRDLEAMRTIRLRLDVWDRLLRTSASPHVFAFTRDVEFPGSAVHSRMFAPANGIPEDPATGGASGPLGCYLVRHGVLEPAPRVEFVSEQGIEMGRPSFIHVAIEQEGGKISAVRVGGSCYFVGEGDLEVP